MGTRLMGSQSSNESFLHVLGSNFTVSKDHMSAKHFRVLSDDTRNTLSETFGNVFARSSLLFSVSDEVRDSSLQSSEAMVGSFVELGEVVDSLLGPFALVSVDLSEKRISAPVPASSVLLEEMPVSADTTETSNASDVSFDNPDSSGSLSEGFEMFVDFVHLVAEDLAPSASGSSAVAVLDTASEVTNSSFDNMFESSARSGAESLSHASDDSFLEVSGDSSCSSEGSFA